MKTPMRIKEIIVLEEKGGIDKYTAKYNHRHIFTTFYDLKQWAERNGVI